MKDHDSYLHPWLLSRLFRHVSGYIVYCKLLLLSGMRYVFSAHEN